MKNDKKTVLIGGSGFIGSRLHTMLKIGSVRIMDLVKPDSDDDSQICDIRDYDAVLSNIGSAQTVVLLAAEHRDDLSPSNLYYDTNVQGTRNVLRAMREKNIQQIIFTSTVALYGLNKFKPNESEPLTPYNHYGKSKLQAEGELTEWWQEDPQNRSLTIIRPTVVFGEDNRGNVYTLMNQIKKHKFMMIGNGKNRKSIAYVGNLAAFIKFLLNDQTNGKHIYNYTDAPDCTINELVSIIKEELNMEDQRIHLPKWLGLIAGYFFDFVSYLSDVKFSISAIRIKKFCANSIYDTQKMIATGFEPPFSLRDGLSRTIRHEFIKGAEQKR